jgi:hypothetical protein
MFTLFVVPSIYMLVARKHAPEPTEETVEDEVRGRSPELRPSAV